MKKGEYVLENLTIMCNFASYFDEKTKQLTNLAEKLMPCA